MANCVTIDPAIGTAQTLIQSVNCYVETSVAQSYGALMGPGGGMRGALTASLIIYVAIMGYRFMLGRSQLSMGDLVPRMLLIGAILALTTSWVTYQTLVYDVLTDGPEEITQMVTRGQAPAASIAERVDRVNKQLTDVANDWGKGPLGIVAPVGPQSSIADAANAARAKAEVGGISPLPVATTSTTAAIGANPFSSAPSYLGWSAMLLTLTAAGSIAITKALLGLLLAIGPVFALFALFDNTRGLAIGWARAAFFLALVPLLATLTSVAMLAMLEPMAMRLSLDAARGIFVLNNALAIFIAVLVMAGIALLSVRVAAMMVSGWIISLKDQMASTARTASDSIHQAYGAADGSALTGSASGYNQPRLDQMVQAIERTNSFNTVQQLQRPDTRLMPMRAPHIQRAGTETKSTRINAFLPGKNTAAFSSPLRPAKSWS